MNIAEMREIVYRDCRYPEYCFSVEHNARGEMFLQGSYLEQDVNHGRMEKQFTRRWLLSPEMVKSEVVQTVFKCVMTSMEHRVRELFKYRGRAVFGPHYDVDALWMICDEGHLDYRGRDSKEAAVAAVPSEGSKGNTGEDVLDRKIG